MQEIKIMEEDWKIMEDYLKGLMLFESETKRSVIPIMGKALNVLFGTVMEEELETIKAKLNHFERDQRSLVQVEKRSISIIKIN